MATHSPATERLERFGDKIEENENIPERKNEFGGGACWQNPTEILVGDPTVSSGHAPGTYLA
jgi:hypothetical protein